jgi:hypothetical protein
VQIPFLYEDNALDDQINAIIAAKLAEKFYTSKPSPDHNQHGLQWILMET